ncbi:hypothetical protein CW304_31705 [Bacillus sp. UFRGS-B20]|nr:hypothetical protein CW304_31705 [Bacillus sp. UFRGS-B20]
MTCLCLSLLCIFFKINKVSRFAIQFVHQNDKAKYILAEIRFQIQSINENANLHALSENKFKLSLIKVVVQLHRDSLKFQDYIID